MKEGTDSGKRAVSFIEHLKRHTMVIQSDFKVNIDRVIFILEKDSLHRSVFLLFYFDILTL